MITDRDMKISCYIEKYKYATIEQIERIFFRNQQYSYQVAAKRLKELYKANLIKIVHDEATNKNIYIWNLPKIEPPSLHRLKVLDVYAELIYLGADVELFEIEKFWNGGKIRSDGLIIFTIGNRRYRFFIEVHMSNHPHNLEKYDTLYKTGEVQKTLQTDYYPLILFISDRKITNIKLLFTEIKQINSKLEKFISVLL